MQIFIAGTDTNIGKTLVASWLCLHSGYDYFKPVQTGSIDVTDSMIVKNIAANKIYPETYLFKQPVSPHQAARMENKQIVLNKIILPAAKNLIVEGAGGVMTPLNQSELMIDLIAKLALPVILVASSRLGTINHTLLSLQALRLRNIKILGVIISGALNQDNAKAIEYYGQTKILMQIPQLTDTSRNSLSAIKLAGDLQTLLTQ